MGLVRLLEDEVPAVQGVGDVELGGEALQAGEYLGVVEGAEGQVVDYVGEIRHGGIQVVDRAPSLDVEIAGNAIDQQVTGKL